METVHAHGTPLAAYLEGDGQLEHDDPCTPDPTDSPTDIPHACFAPAARQPAYSTFVKQLPYHLAAGHQRSPRSWSRIHHAWSRAVNSRLGRADNARFIEHFRYTIVASQLLNEYIDHGTWPPSAPPTRSLDGTVDDLTGPTITTSLFGAALTAALAFALVYLLHWTRNSRDGSLSKGRLILGLLTFILLALVGYAYLRRQWLKFLRRSAVTEITSLTTHWQAFEVSTASALALIQEVELVSRGYRLSTPLPPASRIEDPAFSRRCVQLRQALHTAYTAVISACTAASSTLRTLVDENDLEKYFEVYDISHVDARDALEALEAAPEFGADPESLKHLRVLSYRTNILRRVTLCSLMALEADGGKPDFFRWRSATDSMRLVSNTVSQAVERIQQCLLEMEAIGASPTSTTTPTIKSSNSAVKDKFRSQVRKISMLSSGIKTLQAKMQILREETNRSIEQSEDPADLGPGLMSQYDSIGEDLKDLMRSWEAGKTSLQSNLTKQEWRISLASSGARSTTSSSIGGLTAVDEDGSPAAALKILTGDSLSNRSSMATTPSDEEVFEAIALPRQCSTLTREERMIKMQEDRERQAVLRAKRDENTSMLRELESVINLRPKKGAEGLKVRVTSI